MAMAEGNLFPSPRSSTAAGEKGTRLSGVSGRSSSMTLGVGAASARLLSFSWSASACTRQSSTNSTKHCVLTTEERKASSLFISMRKSSGWKKNCCSSRS